MPLIFSDGYLYLMERDRVRDQPFEDEQGSN